MYGSFTAAARINFIILLAKASGIRMIVISELGITSIGLVKPWAILSHNISLFLSVITGVEGAASLNSLEGSVTGNLLIHVFQVSQVIP